MLRFLKFWRNSADASYPRTRTEKISQFLYNTNEMFKMFLCNCSWFVYFIAGFLILCCIYYHIYDFKRRTEVRRRREEVQRANERLPQKRRPGALYRDREIFRSTIKTLRNYMKSSDDKRKSTAKLKPCLRKTRSGLIYGHFYNNNFPEIDVN